MNNPIKIGTHEGCGGDVFTADFVSGTDQYCSKCGNFGVDRTPLASPFQSVLLIGVSFEGQWTCSSECLVKDLYDGPECRDTLARTMNFEPWTLDEVLVVLDERIIQHGGQDGFRKKQAKVA